MAVNWRAKLSESLAFNEVIRFFFNNFQALRAQFFNNSLVFKYFLASFQQRPFVYNNILASFVLFFVPPLPGSSGPIRLPSRFGRPHRSPTTMCPHEDHHYSLS